MKNNYIKLLLSFLFVALTGYVGSVVTFPSIQSWFTLLEKPSFAPPNWLFGPAWTTLYILIAIAFYIVWNKEGVEKSLKTKAYWIFGIQLVLNALWSIIFFGMQNPGWAFVEIVVLWLVILAMIFSFSKISKSSAWLLLPYILWVTFASVLNYSIWSLM